MPATPKPSPRWLYGFFEFIERLPGPAWLVGLLVILTGSLGLHVAAWRQGLLPYGSLDSYLITLTVYPVMILAAWIFLDGRARTALASFAKSKGKQDRGLERTVTDFISLPPWLAALSFASGIVGGSLNFNVAIGLSPLGGNVFAPYELLSFALVSALLSITILRTVFQAVRLHRLLKGVEVNIFNPAPFYALSRYASQSTLTLVLLNYILTLISLPDYLLTTYGFFSVMLFLSPMLLLFFAPLSSMNRRMRAEKERLLSELGENLNSGVERVLRAARRENYSEINKIRNSISSLKESWELTKKISTWPWEPETVRNLLVPLLFPVIVFLIQRYLGSFFGG